MWLKGERFGWKKGDCLKQRLEDGREGRSALEIKDLFNPTAERRIEINAIRFILPIILCVYI